MPASNVSMANYIWFQCDRMFKVLPSSYTVLQMGIYLKASTTKKNINTHNAWGSPVRWIITKFGNFPWFWDRKRKYYKNLHILDETDLLLPAVLTYLCVLKLITMNSWANGRLPVTTITSDVVGVSPDWSYLSKMYQK